MIGFWNRCRALSVRAHAVLALALIAGSLSSCAKRYSVGELDLASQRQRFDVALAERARVATCEGDLLVWPRVEGWRELPGLQARVLIGGPEKVRLRVGSWFGTAVDFSARGDSVTAYLPSRRVVFETAHAGESLGVAEPGTLGYRILSGVWTPPAGEWEAAVRSDSLLVLDWEEGSAFLRMAVGTSGLPAWVECRTGDDTLSVTYDAWRAWDQVRWPARFAIRDRSGRFEVRCRLEGVRFRDPMERGQWIVPIPNDVERFDAEDLREIFAEAGGS